MTENTKDAAKPKKRPLSRKVVVVVGLMEFALSARLSFELSDPRPSLRSVHDRIRIDMESIRAEDVSDVLGDTAAGNEDMGVFVWYEIDLNWPRLNSLGLMCNSDGSIYHVAYASHERSLVECVQTRWIWRYERRLRSLLRLAL